MGRASLSNGILNLAMAFLRQLWRVLCYGDGTMNLASFVIHSNQVYVGFFRGRVQQIQWVLSAWLQHCQMLPQQHSLFFCVGRSCELFQGRPLSLNSKNVNVALMKPLTRGLGVSETELPDELRQLIKEKLSRWSMNREPCRCIFRKQHMV